MLFLIKIYRAALHLLLEKGVQTTWIGKTTVVLITNTARDSLLFWDNVSSCKELETSSPSYEGVEIDKIMLNLEKIIFGALMQAVSKIRMQSECQRRCSKIPKNPILPLCIWTTFRAVYNVPKFGES